MLDVRQSAITLAVGALLVGACDGAEPAEQQDFPQVRSEKPHDQTPELSAAEAEILASQNHALTFDLYHQLREGEAADRGFSISAYSIHNAFGMLRPGTVGPAREQLDATLHFSLPGERQYVALNWLDAQLAARNLPAEPSEPAAVALDTANGVWMLDDYADSVSRDYLDTLSIHFDAGVYLAQFDRRPEVERMTINAWVAERTANLIPELFAPGQIKSLTTMVLVNAVYLRAAWDRPFDRETTAPAPFFRLDGSQTEVAMMHAPSLRAEYGEGPGYRAIALPLRGGALEVVVIVPDDFTGFEAGLDAASFASLRASMTRSHVNLSLPKFELGARFGLIDELQALGMTHPFSDPHSFDGISPALGVIDVVVHQTVIEVHEEGIEAAAATGIVITKRAPPRPEVTLVVDRPFLLAIRDAPTETLLFFGRVLDPAAGN